MKENKSEIAIVIIMSLLIIGLVIFTIFKVISSTNNLRDNTPLTNLNSNTDNQNLNFKIDIYEQETEKGVEENPKEEVLISTFSTNIYDNDTNRVDNIALAISKINGIIVNEGDVFSFNQTVGPMDYDHGFKESTAFDSEGNKIKVPGGGMCQISSTMYNTALESGLEIVERHAHSRRVDYVPLDRDATIYYDTLDFKFKNTSNFPIKIVATSDNYNVTISFYNIK